MSTLKLPEMAAVEAIVQSDDTVLDNLELQNSREQFIAKLVAENFFEESVCGAGSCGGGSCSSCGNGK